MSNKEFAKKFIKAEDEAWYNGNFELLEELENPNVTYHLLAVGLDAVGWEAHKQQIIDFRNGFSNYHHEWEYLTGDGNYFALSYKMNCVFTGEIPGMPPPTNKEVTANSLFLFRLENGKIAEAWSNGSNNF